jgi:putative serine protease PepD
VVAGLAGAAIVLAALAMVGVLSDSSDAAGGLQGKFTGIVATVSPQVVEIRTGTDLGSGIVYDSHGDVVTNAHVIGNSQRVTIRLSDGTKHPATVVG